MTITPNIDEAKVEQFLGSMVGDLGAAMNAALVRIGDKPGLYRTMAGAGPLTPAELAERTGTTARYVQEWLAAQAAGRYVEYDPATGRYLLPPEQAAVLADEDSPVFMLGGFEAVSAVMAGEPKIAEAFRTGADVGWHEHDERPYEGTERFFRPNYRANLVGSWIPARHGVRARLEAGIGVADVGCGFSTSTILLAQAFPNSTFTGFDYHAASIDRARKAAARQGISDRVRFDVAGAKDYPVPDGDYGLIAFFDCLHDMGDPVGALRYAREALDTEGTVLLVEPAAGDRVEDNLHPVGRVYYCASTLLCTPTR